MRVKYSQNVSEIRTSDNAETSLLAVLDSEFKLNEGSLRDSIFTPPLTTVLTVGVEANDKGVIWRADTSSLIREVVLLISKLLFPFCSGGRATLKLARFSPKPAGNDENICPEGVIIICAAAELLKPFGREANAVAGTVGVIEVVAVVPYGLFNRPAAWTTCCTRENTFHKLFATIRNNRSTQ